MAPFMDAIHLSQGYRTITRRQFTYLSLILEAYRTQCTFVYLFVFNYFWHFHTPEIVNLHVVEDGFIFELP